MRDPVLGGEDPHHTVEIIGGETQVRGDDASLFIDIIGMPLKPVSFAGARRRAYGPAFLRCGKSVFRGDGYCLSSDDPP